MTTKAVVTMMGQHVNPIQLNFTSMFQAWLGLLDGIVLVLILPRQKSLEAFLDLCVSSVSWSLIIMSIATICVMKYQGVSRLALIYLIRPSNPARVDLVHVGATLPIGVITLVGSQLDWEALNQLIG